MSELLSSGQGSESLYTVNRSVPLRMGMALAIALATYAPHPVVSDAGSLSVVSEIHASGSPTLMIATSEMLRIKAKSNRASVEKFSELRKDWDGEGAVQPNSDNLAKLLAAIDELPLEFCAYRPMIANDGEMGIFWSAGDDHAELSVDPEGVLSLYLRDFREDGGELIELKDAPYLSQDILERLHARVV